MLYFTKYAEQKFDILNKHKIFFTREMIEGVIATPESAGRKRKFYYAEKDGVKVVYKREGEMVKVITFFPVK